MIRNKLLLSILSLLIISGFLLSSCNLPAFNSTPTVTLVPPTVKPTSTATLQPTIPPTQAPSLTPLPPTVTKPASGGLSGYMLFDRAKHEIRGFDYATNKELFRYVLNSSDWLNFQQVQYADGTLYYFSAKDKSVYALKGGTTGQLTFLPKVDSIYFRVSQDGKKIAWAFDAWGKDAPGSELWLANIDGSKAFKVMSKDPANNQKFLVLRPHAWLADGRLVFEDEPTGIGGYILFYGFAALGVYDPAMSRWEYLLSATENGASGLCLKEIGPGLKSVITTCATKNAAQVSLISLPDKKVTNFAMLPDQGQSGSPQFSPSGAWLAYGMARSSPDKEFGKVVVIQLPSGAPKEIMTVNGGILKPVVWVDENRLLVERSIGDQNSLWQVNRDGSSQIKLGDGNFSGLIP